MSKISHKPKDFIVFILTNGRPDKVYTYDNLRKAGYTGRICLVIDNEDQKGQEYKDRYGEEVVVFNKKEIAKTFDNGDNLYDMRAIIYARNACFEIARSLGVEYFIQLDDDYTDFQNRFDSLARYVYSPIKNLDNVFYHILEFYKTTNVKSIAMAQGGDFIGGAEGTFGKSITLKRKCMNSFFCSTARPFQFVGRVNEDVNIYTRLSSTGDIFFTINMVSLVQKQTQSNSGGMSEMYIDGGTYIKSFYSILYHPSSVKICEMGNKFKRLHHFVKWKNTTPMILREEIKKK